VAGEEARILVPGMRPRNNDVRLIRKIPDHKFVCGRHFCDGDFERPARRSSNLPRFL
jgi:hypothetical protein